MRLFVSINSDFGLLPTLSACLIQNGRTPLLLLQLLLSMLPERQTTVYTAHNLKCYRSLSLVRQAIAICLISATILDQYSMLPTLIIFRFYESSIKNNNSSQYVIALVCNSERSFLLFFRSVLLASCKQVYMFNDLFCILSTKENLNFFGYRLQFDVILNVCSANSLAFNITLSSVSAIYLFS